MVNKLFRRLARYIVASGLLFVHVAHPAFAGPADCDGQLTDAQKEQRTYCEGHLGCALVFSIFDSCVTVKKWLNALPFSKSGSAIDNGSVVNAVKGMRSVELLDDPDAPTLSDCLPGIFDRARCRIYLGIDKAPPRVVPAPPPPPPPLSPETERRARVLALYKEAESSRQGLGTPYGDVAIALNSCMEARQFGYRDRRCAEAQNWVQRCNDFRADWLKRKAAVLADINQAEPGVGAEYTPGTSPLRGLGRQANASEMWNDTVRGLKSLEIAPCPSTLPNSALTPEEALAQWDAEDKGLLSPGAYKPKSPAQPLLGQNPGGQNPNGQNPGGQNPNTGTAPGGNAANPVNPAAPNGSAPGQTTSPGNSQGSGAGNTPANTAGNNSQNDPNNPASSSRCVPDEALLQKNMEVQHELARNNSAFKPMTHDDGLKYYADVLSQIENSSPDTLQGYMDRDADWVAKNRSSRALSTRLVIASGDVIDQLRRCVIAKAKYQAQAKAQAGSGKPAGGVQGAAGNIGNSGAGTGGAGKNYSGSCKSAYDQQEADFAAINKRNPKTDATIPQLQTVMYMLKERMSLLDRLCKGQPQYGEYASVQKSYNQSVVTCKAIATSDSVCIPRLAW